MTTINTPTGWDEWWNNKKVGLVNETKNKVSDTLDIPQELKAYREAWEQFFDWDMKDKIITAANKIRVKVEKDSDGSRLVEFKLWDKKYKILDPILENHTDDIYRQHGDYSVITKINRDEVLPWWMVGNDINNWKNQKLKSYVKKKQSQWLHIPTREEMNQLLNELWKKTWLTEYDHQSALLMYLTGMDWFYWIDSDESIRSWMDCRGCISWWFHTDFDNFCANLCMISCE